MTARYRGISVLNNCLEWDKFVRLTLTYLTPDGCSNVVLFPTVDLDITFVKPNRKLNQ